MTGERRQRIIDACADIAIATGAVVAHVGADAYIVPDVAAIEMFANGTVKWESPTNTRDDGRAVWICRLSEIEAEMRAITERPS